jgi:uncharacterized protein (DUF488 family)
MAKAPVWTIGHSTRTLDEFAALLHGQGITIVVDIRAFPGSRRHPHFAREALAKSLPKLGFRYEWLGRELGGRRRTLAEPSPNGALRNDSFRNYADYMGTPEFAAGIDRLLALADEAPTAYFCAELLWWRCHRALVSDYLAAVRGRTVLHILGSEAPKPHTPKAEARVVAGRLLYPPAEPGLPGLDAPRRRR